MAMQSVDLELYQIAVILPLRGDYDTAVESLDEVFLRHTLQSTSAEFTLGRAGIHHMVLVTGLNDTSAADSVAAMYPDLLEAFPCIRAGFLVGVDAIAPQNGLAKPGDVVVGISQRQESGITRFDLDKSRDHKRLCITGHWGKPPKFVQSAVGHTLLPSRLCVWYEYLDRNSSTMMCPDEPTGHNPAENHKRSEESAARASPLSQFNLAKLAPNVFKGRIGSSSQRMRDSELFHNPEDGDAILCYETAAANLRGPLPLLVVCGVSETDPPSLPGEHAMSASKVASLYTIFLASQLNSLQLIRGRCLRDTYNHQSFSLERPAFRLLRLEQGTTLPIRCSIFEAYLDEPDTLIDYEALSYAWGSSDKSEIILVDGRVLSITKSLLMALQHLRQEDVDRILWTDAICIDQSNVAERSHQVTSMGSIYERATNVVIWLGSVSESAGLLISALNKLQHQVFSQAFRTSQRAGIDWGEVWDNIKPKQPTGRRDLSPSSGLHELTSKPWFTRVWILQEVAKARRAQIHCTAGIVDAKLFTLAPWLLRARVSSQARAVLDIMPGPSRQSSWWSRERELGDLLWRFRDCQATDPRDRVYALLGIISNVSQESIKPDYSKNELEVLRDVYGHIFGDDGPIELSQISSIEGLQRELDILSIVVSEPRIARWVSPDEFKRSLHRRGHARWAEGIRKLANSGLGRTSLAFVLTRLDVPPTAVTRVLHEGVPMSGDALTTLLGKATLHYSPSEFMRQPTLIVIRAGRDTLNLLSKMGGPEERICHSILDEAILAGEDAVIYPSISQRLKKFLYNSIPGTST